MPNHSIPDPQVRRDVTKILGKIPHQLVRTNGHYSLIVSPGTNGKRVNRKRRDFKRPPRSLLRDLKRWHDDLPEVASV